jgi:hypothetical protein
MAMSFQAMADVIKLRLPTNEKFILLMLANYADQDGKCWPSVERLAADTGLSESSVHRALNTLRSYSGLIGVELGGGRGNSSRYVLGLEAIKTLGQQGCQGDTVLLKGVTEKPILAKGCQGDSRKGVTVTPEPIIEPINKNQTHVRSKPTALPSLQTSPAFDRFWDAYPATKRRVAKKACWDVWRKHSLDAIAEQIIGHVRALATTEAWTTGYEPAPLTYLHQRRWEDGLPVAAKPKARVAL